MREKVKNEGGCTCGGVCEECRERKKLPRIVGKKENLTRVVAEAAISNKATVSN